MTLAGKDRRNRLEDTQRMNPEAYWYVLAATLAGGMGGVLVMWNRKRAEASGSSRLRRAIILVVGTMASVCALIAFSKAFGAQSPLYAVTAMTSITGWAALVNSAAHLPLPRFLLVPRRGELSFLRSPCMGVRWFGKGLKNTPLRHLGGRVFLAERGANPRTVLEGIREAQAVHHWALLLSCPWLVYWAAQGRWAAALCALAIHTPLNVYPILHLRYTTCRIEEHLTRAAACQATDRSERFLSV